MAKTKGPRKDQKKRSQGTSRTGKTNQYRAKGKDAIGSRKPAAGERGRKNWTRDE